MLHLTNDDVLRLLTMEDTIDALRIGFDELADRNAAHVPRLELWTPVSDDDSYHCLGSMSGATKRFGIAAMRIKSDIISWPEGKRQEKYAVEPGTYCGFILLFSTETGQPLALVNDGVIQRMRVGASAGIGIDRFAPADATTLGMLGAGDMAREYLRAIAAVRPLEKVLAYSPTEANREAYAAEMRAELGLDVVGVDTPQEAVGEQEIVATATNAMVPTLDPAWLSPGTTVVCVTRRELGAELVDSADRVIQLGPHSLPTDIEVADLEFPQSAAGGYVSGDEDERSRLPWKHNAEKRQFPGLIDVMRGDAGGRATPDETVLFVNVGLQGIQFASVGARLYQRANEAKSGAAFPGDAFLQNIRD